MRKFVFSSILLAFLGSAFGQCPLNSPEVILMADGSGDTYSWQAGLYNSSQIGVVGNITTITFRLDNPVGPSETYNNQAIYLRHTTVTDYNGNQTYPGTAGFTLVWSGTLNINSVGFYNISLTTPFNYNGTDILEVLFENKSNHNPWDDLWFDRTDASTTLYNGKLGSGWSWSSATTDNTKRHFNLALGFNAPNTVNCESFQTTLPIELLSFTAKKQNNNVNLEWITASETNNDYFTIEHSVDGIYYSEIAEINGAGNSIEQKTYTYIDENPKEGTNYYRLRQTDFDGSFAYSEIKTVNINTEISSVNIYPNPVNGNTLTIETNGDENLIFTLYDNIGAKMDVSVVKDNNKQTIDVSSLPKGLYFLETQMDNVSKYRKILIM